MFTAKRCLSNCPDGQSAVGFYSVFLAGRQGPSSFHVALRGVRVNFFDALTVREKQRVGWRRVGLRVLLYT